MASFYYSAFGLSLLADQPLPGLAALPAACAVNVQIHLGSTHLHGDCLRTEKANPPWYTSPACDSPGQPVLLVWRPAGGSYYLLRYSDATEFVVDRAGSQIWATWPDSSTLADTAIYLLGPILGLVLRLRGVVCLHASAVAWNGRAFALVGPAGAGKSTLAAAFARRGDVILSDDITALRPAGDAFLIEPAYPQLRLWPDSTRRLYGDDNALPRLTPTWDKRGLDLTRIGYHFASEPAPLSAIYLLGERRVTGAPRVEDAPPEGRLTALAGNTYVNYLLDKEQRASEFVQLGRLVATTPMRCAVAHEDPAQLERLCDALIDDFRRLTS